LDAERRQRLTKAISDLPERERLVITLYYYEELTMKEIGIILGVVESRVCQINAATLLHLRARLSAPANTEESRQEETRPERVRKRRARRRTEGFIPPGLRKGERLRESQTVG
jgi:RNA polymerase sigma factor for flagellar operon FliA